MARGRVTQIDSPVTVYGIPNCDQVRKARSWLDVHQVEHNFHDFKKQGLSTGLANKWIEDAGAERIINRKGATWRGLDDASKARADKATDAVALVCEQPSLIKRPVLEHAGKLLVGFDPEQYASLFT
jgi:arsenate reductase